MSRHDFAASPRPAVTYVGGTLTGSRTTLPGVAGLAVA